MYKTKLRDTWIGDATGSSTMKQGSEPLKNENRKLKELDFKRLDPYPYL